MYDATRLIEAAQTGDRQAAAELLPLVHDELRKLAAAKMAAEPHQHTLSATAVVHEVYLRLAVQFVTEHWLPQSEPSTKGRISQRLSAPSRPGASTSTNRLVHSMASSFDANCRMA